MNTMIEYKLYFGLNIGGKPRIDPEEVKRLIANYFGMYAIDGYTIQLGVGYWQNITENTVILTLLVEDAELRNHIEKSLRTLSKDYCEVYKQDSVLFTKLTIWGEYIENKT